MISSIASVGLRRKVAQNLIGSSHHVRDVGIVTIFVSDSAHAYSLATAIHAVPAERLDRGFRLLVLRQYHVERAPPAFAWIDQRLLRTPPRLSRHGLFFANTFRPEIVAWLSEQLGRPSLRDATGRAHRNPRWPTMRWHSQDRSWPDGTRTIEWFVDVGFQDVASWTAFQRRWHEQLGGIEGYRPDYANGA